MDFTNTTTLLLLILLELLLLPTAVTCQHRMNWAALPNASSPTALSHCDVGLVSKISALGGTQSLSGRGGGKP